MAVIRLYAAARAVTGRSELTSEELELAGEFTIDALLAALAHRVPDAGPVLRSCSLLVDGVRQQGGNSVSPQAVIDVLPPFAGG